MRPQPALALVLAFVFAIHASAQQEGSPKPATSLSPAQLQSALSFLQSRDPDRRAAAYKASQDRGETFRETYLELLDSAREYHTKEFTRTLDSQFGPRSTAAKLAETWRAWQQDAETARTHIQTDHDKASDRLAEMDRLFAAASRSWQALQRTLPSDAAHQATLDSLAPHAQALYEIARERAADPSTIDTSTGAAQLATIERELRLGDRLNNYLAAYDATAALIAQHRDAGETNAAYRWPSKDQKTFATILNARRATVGLGPFLLNENLSAACDAHSKEMAALSYFAHESPVAENKTPAMRAQKAGFDGFAGECIFMGSTSPEAAEQAWWYSCGHRLINYASGPTILGIAHHQLHWTLNTGR